jgi:hypothetical protein
MIDDIMQLGRDPAFDRRRPASVEVRPIRKVGARSEHSILALMARRKVPRPSRDNEH